jgi:hypothetical protein
VVLRASAATPAETTRNTTVIDVSVHMRLHLRTGRAAPAPGVARRHADGPARRSERQDTEIRYDINRYEADHSEPASEQ